MTKFLKPTVIILSLILFAACGKEEDKDSSIPERRVVIDINITLEHQFVKNYHTKTYPNNGYGGVLVVSDALTNIYAYDLCCPYEAPLINVIKVINDLQAQCPKCKTIYNIADGTGRKESGISNEHLKRYKVYHDGDWFRIRN